VLNFQTSYMTASSPNLDNWLILAAIGLVTLATLRRGASGEPALVREQTDQVKGLAILLVVLGHLWVHVAHPKAWLVMSGEAVAVFLMLSGYGLTCSFLDKSPAWGAFIARRVRRVMVPYWIITVMILGLDYLILDRTYPAGQVALTLLGINITPLTQNLDYVRWFVTFLLVWYVLFALTFSWLRPRLALLALLVCAHGVMMLEYYVLHVGWYHHFAFVAGCSLAYRRPGLRRLARRHPAGTVVLGLVGLAGFGVVKYFLPVIKAKAPSSLAGLAVGEINSLVFGLSILALAAWAGRAGWSSRFLLFCGAVSYELFLLHGPFLVKYNPVFHLAQSPPNTWSLPLAFGLLLAGLLVVAAGLQKVIRRVNL